MEINEYIASGIIDRYVLGFATEQEQQEVSCMSHIYPEIAAEVLRLQGSIEKLAEHIAVSPPFSLKAKILARIKQEEQYSKDRDQTKIVELNATPSKLRVLRITAAASILLLVALSVFTFLLQNRYEKSEELLADQQELIETIQDSEKGLNSELNEAKDLLAFIQHEKTRRIGLSGTENHPSEEAVVYWNDESQEVRLKTSKLTSTPSDKQYQLWAIVDGAPVDMGVFSHEGDVAVIKNLKKTASAQAFAITLEPMGGSVNPTMEAMFVIGMVV